MKKIFILLSLFFASHYAQAACTALTPGMNASQIQTAFTTCASGGGGVVNAPAGSYSITSIVTLPCNVSLSGPVITYKQTHYQTAIFNGSSSFLGQAFHTTAGCTNLQSISYIEWNGQQPLNGGGGIDVVPGTTNFTADHNWIHGSNASQYSGSSNMAGILLDGITSSPLTQNITITLNEFGAENYTDCGYPNGAMNEPDSEGGGGFCAGVISQGQTKNVSVDHNIFHFIEQGGKVVEATSNHGNTQNMNVTYNVFHDYSRIGFETQSNITDATKPTSQNIQYNFFGNRYSLGQFNFDISMANGCGTCVGHMDYNAFIQDQAGRSGGQEVWGVLGTTGNYNLMEGDVAHSIGGGITWSSSGQFNFNNNTFNILSGSNTNCLTANSGYWAKESSNNPSFSPTCTGNSYSNVGRGTYTSQIPTISPNGGTFAGSQLVTLACPTCTNRDVNTSIWYTTDGSTPVAGTSKLYTAPFTITSSTVIKAIGMWGAINQPYSYPSGYGFVPSALVTASFSSGPAPTLQTITLSSTGGITTFASGATNQLIATGHYNDGSTQNISSTASFTSSNTAVGTVTSPGGFYTAGGTASTTNINANLGAISTTTPLVLTTTVAQPTITGGFLSNTGSVNTIAIGAGTIQFVANANYTDGQTRTLPDIYGNYPATWSITPNSSVCGTISPYVSNANPGGLFTPTTVGTCNVFVKTNTGSIFSSWGMTVTAAAATLQSITLTATGGATSITTGSTLQLIATGNYSDGSHQTLTSLINSWASSDNTKATISSGGLITGVATGTPTFTATYQSVTSSPALSITITSSIVLQSVTISNSLGTNVFAQGWTVPWKGMCGYSNGDLFDCTNTDGHGNQAVFSSSNTAKVSFSSNISSAVAQGTSTVTATAASVPSMPAVVTVTVAPTQVFNITGGQVVITGNQMVFSGVGSGTAPPPPPTQCIVLITTFGGAIGNGSTDATTAIQNTFNYAKTNSCLVEIPSGTFVHSGILNANSVSVFGLGSSSILKATNASTSAIELSGAGPSLTNVVLLGTGSSRNTGPQQSDVWINSAIGFTVNGVLINGGSCTGIWDQNGANGTIQNNTVENTLADSITNTNGASNILVQNNLVINSGDDGISNNSYTNDSNTVNHITVNQNSILRNAFARSLEVSGGTNITFSNNYVDNKSGYACMILASETSSFTTQKVDTVNITGNTFANCGPNQGSLFFWPDGAGNILSNIIASGNQFYNGGQQTFTAVQITGAGIITNTTVQNSSAYITPGPNFFSSSFTGTGSVIQSGNNTFTSASYPGPIAPPLGGTVPVFSLAAGTYTYPQNLTLTETTSGDTIQYCSSSSSCLPTVNYIGTIVLNAPTTICSKGINSSSSIPVPSTVVCAIYK